MEERKEKRKDAEEETTQAKPVSSQPSVKSDSEKTALYAVIRLRGSVNTKKAIKDTLDIMKLNRVNHCVLIPSNPSNLGMLKKAENYLTWGEINEQTLGKLIFKRGVIDSKRVGKPKASELSEEIMSSGKNSSSIRVFRLNPPSKGFKSTRKFFPDGDLGYRGDKINVLLKRMI